MKKSIVFIICMAICLSLIGGAIAVSFYAATPETGTITADSALILTLGGSSETGLELVPTEAQVYDIYAQIQKSASAASEKGQLVITITTTEGDYDLSDVTFGLYEESTCENAINDYEDLTVSAVDGTLTLTVSNIASSTHYYLRVYLDEVADADALAAVNGNINIALNRQAA